MVRVEVKPFDAIQEKGYVATVHTSSAVVANLQRLCSERTLMAADRGESHCLDTLWPEQCLGLRIIQSGTLLNN